MSLKHPALRHTIHIAMLFFVLSALSACKASSQAGDSSQDHQLATQEQALGPGSDDGGEGSDSGNSDGEFNPDIPTWTRLPECELPQIVIDNQWFKEQLPSERTRIPGCPEDTIWHGELRILHTWRQDQPFGYLLVDTEEPAVVELLIIPDGKGGGDVLSNPEVKYSFPVTLSGEQTFDNDTCQQSGKGHYRVNIDGYCKDGWLVLTKVELPFTQDEETKLKCSNMDEPIKVDSWVPDGTMGFNTCFLISYASPHGLDFIYEDGHGGRLETTLVLTVGDANVNEMYMPIVPLK